MKTTCLSKTFLLLATLGSLAFSSHGEGAVVARFTDGMGTTLPDQYAGRDGAGWMAGWTTRVGGSDANSSLTVVNTNPLRSGSGNYLSVSYAKLTAATARVGVSRRFDPVGTDGGIDLSQAYTIAFDLRIDSISGWDASNDQIQISSESTTTIGGFGGDIPWMLWARGDLGWVLYDGNGTGSVTSVYLSSLGAPIALTEGTLYHVEVDIDPVAKDYDLVLTIGANSYRASAANGGERLGFRQDAPSSPLNVFQIRSTMGTAGDAIDWSFDNLEVTAVPEPGMAGLVLAGLAFAGWRRWRAESILRRA